MVTVALLGPLHVTADNGRRVDLGAPLQRSLLAFLALAHSHHATVDQLVDALWFEPPRRAVNVVQQYVSALRRVLGSTALTSHAGGYQLNLRPEDLDVSRLEHLVRMCTASREAGELEYAALLATDVASLHRGPPLHDVPDCPYREAARTSIDELLRRARLLQAALHSDLRHFSVAIELTQGLAADHPLDEAVVAELMRALTGAGRQSEALATFDRARRALVTELGIEPGPVLRHAQEAVLRQDPTFVAPAHGTTLDDDGAGPRHPEITPATRPSPSLAAAPVFCTPVPHALTELIGREDAISEVESLLEDPRVRIVSIVGPGGVGKTRLANEVAARASRRRVVLYLPLDRIRDPELVGPTIRSALRNAPWPERAPTATPPPSPPGAGHVLLVLDNFEHVMVAAPEVSRTLEFAASSTQVLLTSREALRVHGEHLYRLSPLDTETPSPDAAAHGTEPETPSGAAVRLFIQRARTVDRGFDPQPYLREVAAICRRLDGLPLAVELAAARTQLLPPTTILDRLERRLGLLTTGDRDAPERQRSLRACLEWSVGLLTEDETRLLAALSVFDGGVTLSSLEAVAHSTSIHDPLGVSDSLLAKSLILLDGQGPGRRVMLLETIREYADELLDVLGLREDIDRAHSRHYHQLLSTDLSRPTRPPRTAAEARLWSAEFANGRKALHTLSRLGDVSRMVDLLCAMSQSLLNSGFGLEFERFAAPLLTRADIDPVRRAELLVWSSESASARGDLVLAVDHLRRALPLVSREGLCPDAMVEAIIRILLCLAAQRDGDVAEQHEQGRLAFEAAQRSGSEEILTYLPLWGIAGLEGDLLPSVDAGVRTARRTENLALEANVLIFGAERALAEENPDALARAESWSRRAGDIALLLGDPLLQTCALSNAGAAVLLTGGDGEQAAGDLRAGLALARRIGDDFAQAECLLRLAGVVATQGHAEVASTLYRAWQHAAREHDHHLTPSNRRIRDTFLAGPIILHGDPAADASTSTTGSGARGSSASLAEATAVALGELPANDPPALGPEDVTKPA